MLPPREIDIAFAEWDSCEVSDRALCAALGICMGILEAPVNFKFSEQTAAVERVDRGCPEAAESEGKLFERRVRVECFLDHEDGALRQGEFGGKEKPDGTCADDDRVAGRFAS